MAKLDPWAHSSSETCNFSKNFKKSKFYIFDLTLNLISIFYNKIKLNSILTLIFEFYVEIGA